MDELLPILRQFDIKVVDTDALSISDQIGLFASAELVVGIHGAGLGNLIFRRRGKCAILEIFPPLEAVVSFPWLADQMEFRYDALSGYTDEVVLDRMQPFKVDPKTLERKLLRLGLSHLPKLD